MTEKELEKAKRHQRALRIVKRWRLLDDEFMKRCFKDNIPAVECILRIIMEKKDLVVKTVRIEDTIPNLQGRGIRLDVHAIDANGKEYDIEVQRADKGASEKRARFNSSLLDLNSLKKGDKFAQLPETYVIFITEHDVLQFGLARYHIERMICETQTPFHDEEHIIYVNGAYEGNDDIGKLTHDFRSRDAESMLLSPLKETVIRYKENPKEVTKMCKELEDWLTEEKANGIAEGKAVGKIEGRAEGETRLATLLNKLMTLGRTQDITSALNNLTARQRLYQEFHIE